jgi:hypothetical protein
MNYIVHSLRAQRWLAGALQTRHWRLGVTASQGFRATARHRDIVVVVGGGGGAVGVNIDDTLYAR